MLLERVDTFDKAASILQNEEQAASDSQKCSSDPVTAEVNATSAYKKHQKEHRSQPATSGNEGNKKPPYDYLCKRCDRPNHWSDDCYAKDQICKACKKVGHYASACKTRQWDTKSSAAQANSCRAYNEIETQNNDILKLAGKIDRAQQIGYTFNVTADAVEEEIPNVDRAYIDNGWIG